MKTWLIGVLAVAVAATMMPSLSEAKRLGGGGSSGMQRNMPARTAPDAPPAKPASPTPQQPSPAPAAGAAPAAAGAAGAAATAGKRSWMGPIAGLAAGLGLAALMSHLGLGEAFANFLMLALLAVAVIALVVFLMRRFGGGAKPALAAGQQRTGAAGGAQVAWPQPTPAGGPSGAAADPVMPRAALDEGAVQRGAAGGQGSGGFEAPQAATPNDDTVAQTSATPKAFVPAAFDSEGFARTAKMIFIRLQTANDNADLDDLRRFTTPELFAAIRLEIQERGSTPQQTDVQRVDAEVLDVAHEDGRQIVSVRFSGEVVETAGGPVQAFNEVWHLVKPLDDSRSWAIAGIEQMQ